MLIILNFYVIFYFNAIVKTDKVVMTKPPTIESYDDIINSYPGKRPAFFQNLDTHVSFSKAYAGSKEGRIWQNAKRTGLNKSLISDFYRDTTSFGRSDIIYFAPGKYVKYIACFYCALRKQLESPNTPMGKSDDSAQEKIFVFLLSGHLPSSIASRVMQVFGRLLPSGFADSILAQAYMQQGTTFEDFYLCLSNVVRFPDQDFSGINMTQCNKLMLTVIILSAVSFIILLMEILFRRTEYCIQVHPRLNIIIVLVNDDE